MTTTATCVPNIRTRRSGAAFFVKADTPAMVGGMIDEGDLLFVKPDEPIIDGDTVLVVSKIGQYVAKVLYVDGAIHLTPVSPDLQPLVISGHSSIRLYRIWSVHKSV